MSQFGGLIGSHLFIDYPLPNDGTPSFSAKFRWPSFPTKFRRQAEWVRSTKH